MRVVNLFKIGRMSWHASGKRSWRKDRNIFRKGAKWNEEGEKGRMEEEVEKAQEGSANSKYAVYF